MQQEDAYWLLQRGSKLLKDGHAHQAALVLEKAAALEPAKTSIRETLARAFYNSGQTSKAEAEFQAVLDADPTNDYAHFGLGLCQARTGKRRSAIGHLKLALAMRPDSDAYRRALIALKP